MRIIAHAHQEHDRAEDLFLRDVHFWRDIGQDRRLEVVPLVAKRAFASCDQSGALGNGPVDRPLYHVELKRRDDRADIDEPFTAAALPKLSNQLYGSPFEGVVDALVDENPLGSDTVLPAIDVATRKRGVDRLFEVRIIADDESVLATKLHHDRDDPLRAGFDDATPVANRANEEDRIDRRASERGACGSVSLDRLNEIWVVSSFFDELAKCVDELRARPGDPLGWLEDDRVPRHESWDHRIDDVLEWIVPRNDCGDDAERVVLEACRLVQQQARRDTFWA